MASYDAGQLKVIRTINAVARRRYGNDPVRRKRYSETAMTIGRVESNFHNVKGGDADSTNWRQERASIYGGDMSIRRSVNRVFDEMEQHDKGQDIGTLAADVQRPAAQYRSRYGLHVAEAKKLAGGGTTLGSEQRGQLQAGTAPTLNPGGETTDSKGAMLAALLDHRKGMSLLDRYQAQVGSGSFTTTTKPSVTDGKAPLFKESPGNVNSAPGQEALVTRANTIDARHLPYKWGGGHGDDSGLLDCSGAVSKLLGINPRVASQFMKWGKPGRGRDFTIYAKPTHVLVEIGGHFWGTSASNPGGGAGWIPRSQISADYLKGFTARH